MKLIACFVSLSFILLSHFSMAQGNIYLKKYSGTYLMLIDGEKVNTPDKYIFTPEGKCVWTFSSKNESGKLVPTKNIGTWQASEGLIQMVFSIGDGEEGSELLTDFHLQDGVFRGSEGGIYLKKVVAKVPVKSTTPAKK